MIQPLRTAHRRIFMVLAVLLPAIIVLGLSERHVLVKAKGSSISPDAMRMSAASAVWEKNTLTTEFFSDPSNRDTVHLFLKSVHELRDPDLLLYWTAEARDQDLSHARLLGTFVGGRAYSLTREQHRGYLILYSLAHNAIVDRAKIERLP
jgi:hypothetical protein